MRNSLKKIIILLLPCFILVSCYKNETKYVADEQNKGLSIFSNTGNNIFSCYINDSPWRTINRTTAGFLARPTSELFIYKQNDSTNSARLIIEWSGNFLSNPNNFDRISLYLSVPGSFSNKDIAKLQGQRITIDSTTNGYFQADVQGFSGKGSGSIYFNKASFDSTASGTGTGSLSGLLEASFSTFKITNGRFDHQLTYGQVYF